MTAQPEAAPIVVRDVFPAEVAVNGQVYRTARAIVTRDRLLVYLTTAAPILDTPYDPAASTVPAVNAPSSRATRLALVGGGTASINRQRGCGCGNPLKGWTPWQPYRKATS